MKYLSESQKLPCLLICLLISTIALANTPATVPSEFTSGEYKAYFSVFNSTFIQPQTARAYNLKRDPRSALVNIAVHHNGRPVKAEIEGVAENLLQQKQKLSFQLINEDGYYYYLAPVKFTNEELIKFTVKASASDDTFSFNFSRKLYEG